MEQAASTSIERLSGSELHAFFVDFVEGHSEPTEAQDPDAFYRVTRSGEFAVSLQLTHFIDFEETTADSLQFSTNKIDIDVGVLGGEYEYEITFQSNGKDVITVSHTHESPFAIFAPDRRLVRMKDTNSRVAKTIADIERHEIAQQMSPIRMGGKPIDGMVVVDAHGALDSNDNHSGSYAVARIAGAAAADTTVTPSKENTAESQLNEIEIGSRFKQFVKDHTRTPENDEAGKIAGIGTYRADFPTEFLPIAKEPIVDTVTFTTTRDFDRRTGSFTGGQTNTITFCLGQETVLAISRMSDRTYEMGFGNGELDTIDDLQCIHDLLDQFSKLALTRI